jgi:UDP-N-acetylmuramoylalanine--D-glutamate ligase
MNIGIWGLGRVGTAALNYFGNHQASLSVVNNKPLSETETTLLQTYNACFMEQSPETIEELFKTCDRVIVSPGIDFRNFEQFSNKLICELDIFSSHITIPTIAITGSVAKTSVTTLLNAVLNASGKTSCAAGNIGIPVLEVINNHPDIFVLEVSSFQLEYTQQFAPDIAIWTNFHPNHLDRHGTEDEYFDAKCAIFAHQHAHQQSLIPIDIIPLLEQRNAIKPSMRFFSLEKPSLQLLTTYPNHTFYWLEPHGIIIHKNSTTQMLISRELIPNSSFVYNWIIIAATLHMLKLDPSLIAQCPSTALEHRLEYVTTINNVAYYNDSKSTIGQSTLAAVNNFPNKSIVLILGGLSKGVDRSPIIQQLTGKVKKVICFGAETEQLASLCTQFKIDSEMCETLENACLEAKNTAISDDIVIFSPGGSSFDLFTNYEQRGTRFKQLINNL